MPSSVLGLPLHPLLVHATVVIVPAAAVAVLLAAVWPRFRRWAKLLPLGLAVAGLILDPLSTSSGENLEHQVGQNSLIEKHSHLADMLLPWMVALVVAAAGLLLWHRRAAGPGGRPERSGTSWLAVAISVIAVVAALGTGVQVVLIGHSGAQAAWHGVGDQSGSASSGQ